MYDKIIASWIARGRPYPEPHIPASAVIEMLKNSALGRDYPSQDASLRINPDTPHVSSKT